jgi:hypothetical protein
VRVSAVRQPEGVLGRGDAQRNRRVQDGIQNRVQFAVIGKNKVAAG